MSWPKIKKIIWSVVFLLDATTANRFLIGLWHVTKMGFYTITSSVVEPRNSKALLKAKLAPKKGHGHCLVICCWSDPWKLSESQWNHYIWEVCSAHWWDARRREWLPTPVFLPEEFYGQRSLVGYSPWGRKERIQLSNFYSLFHRKLQRLRPAVVNRKGPSFLHNNP